MEKHEKLTRALAAGSVIMSRPNTFKGIGPEEEIEIAYHKLKRMLQEQYGQVDEDLLDIGPGSEKRQAAMTRQLEETGAAEDEAILQQAQALLEIIYKVEPTAIWASAVAEPPSHLK